MDALKNYRKRRVSQITKQLQDDVKAHGTFTTLLQYLKFVNKHHSSIEKLEALQNNEHINSRIAMPVGLSLLLSMTEILMTYGNDTKLDTIRLVSHDYRHRRTPGLRTLCSRHEQIFGTSFQTLLLSAWVYFPYCNDFRFEDVVALGKAARAAQEAEVIVNRLAQSGEQTLPKYVTISGDELFEFRCKLIDELFEERELTYDTIGKKVILLKDNCVYSVTLLSFTGTVVFVSLWGMAMPFPRTIIKNIMENN